MNRKILGIILLFASLIVLSASGLSLHEYSVGLDDLEDRPLEGETIDVNASASGPSLDQLRVLYRLEDSVEWLELGKVDCSGDECSGEFSYSRKSPGSTDFMAIIGSGDDVKMSEKRTVLFREREESSGGGPPDEDDGESISVTLDNLPERSAEGETIEVSGSASGASSEKVRILFRLEDSVAWQELGESNCMGGECSFLFNYTRRSPGLTDFMAVIRSEEGLKMSKKESVYFSERDRREDDDQDEENESKTSVELEDLPERHRANRDLDISAEAEGEELERLEIQRRGEDTIVWSRLKRKDCGGSSTCSLTVEDFESEEGRVTFRARVSSGDEVKFSGQEIVKFYGDRDRNGDEDEAFLEVEVEDEENDPLEDARVEAENGEDRVRYTDSDGEASFWLEADEYDVEVSKDGYETEDRSVDLEEGEDERLRFELEEDEDYDDEDREDIRILRIEYPEEVCSGEDLRVNVVIENSLDDDETVAVWGVGLGGTDSRVLDVDEDELEETEIVFEEVDGSGSESFTIRMDNSRSDSRTRSVRIRNCQRGDDGFSDYRGPSGLTASVKPREVVAGESIRVYGEVSGAKSPQEVTIRAFGDRERLSSDRDGGYRAFFTPEEVGKGKIEVSAAGFTRTREVEVVPSAEIRRLEAPRTVFAGERFEACAEVDSQVDARVLLQRDGRTLESTNGNGRICFEVEAGDIGTYEYRFRALTYGTGSEAVKRVEVLENREQVSSFPDSVAVTETEGGTVRATIYNTRESTTEYSLEIEGIDDRLVSPDSRSLVLPKGGEETVYFYFTPRKTGSYSPELSVEASGEEVFSREIELESLSERENRGERLLGSLNRFLTG